MIDSAARARIGCDRCAGLLDGPPAVDVDDDRTGAPSTSAAAASPHRDTERHADRRARVTRPGSTTPSMLPSEHGYALFADMDGIECIDMPGMGGMGVHYVNGDDVATPSVNLRHPEAVVYERVGGRLRLVALEYVVLKADWESVHGADAPRPKLFGHRFDFTGAGNRYGLPPFYSLHAWIWKHNPAGRFAMWNPDVHCDCAHSIGGRERSRDRRGDRFLHSASVSASVSSATSASSWMSADDDDLLVGAVERAGGEAGLAVDELGDLGVDGLRGDDPPGGDRLAPGRCGAPGRWPGSARRRSRTARRARRWRRPGG